jgi:hypothetical protein
MMILATGSGTSTAPPSAFFERWTDHDTWGEWSPDTEWVRLDGPVALGATGVLKPKGGPKTRFVISALEPGRVYTDTSYFPGARLDFVHTAERTGSTTELAVRVSVRGPLARLWGRILGAGFRDSVQHDLDRLTAIVESAQALR